MPVHKCAKQKSKTNMATQRPITFQNCPIKKSVSFLKANLFVINMLLRYFLLAGILLYHVFIIFAFFVQKICNSEKFFVLGCNHFQSRYF